MVRQAFISQIQEVLGEQRPFQAADFDIVQDLIPQNNTQGNMEQVSIIYRFEASYSFQLRVINTNQHGTTPTIIFTARPGDISDSGNGMSNDGSMILVAIRSWLTRIAEDLARVPSQRLLDEQQAAIDKLTADVGDIPNTYYTREEAADLEARLDAMRTQLYEHMKQTTQDDAVIAEKIGAIDSDIEELKASLETLRRPGWRKAAATRFLRWTSQPENRALLEAGTQLLLTEGKRHIQ